MNSNKKQNQKVKKKESNFFYNFAKITGGPFVLIWLRPKVIYAGKTKKKDFKGMLICANHEWCFDPLILQCVFWDKNIYFLAMKEMFDTKRKEFFYSRMHCIPVDRNNFNVSSMRAVLDKLKANKNVVIFPEGKVHGEKGEGFLQFKGGAPLIAYLSGAKVLPCYIVPKESKYARRKIVFGDPIDVRKSCAIPSMANIDEAGNLIRQEVIKLKNFYENLKEKKHDN